MMPGEPLRPGAIYNSNRYTLRGLIQSLGCECADLGIVPDRLDATSSELRHAKQELAAEDVTAEIFPDLEPTQPYLR